MSGHRDHRRGRRHSRFLLGEMVEEHDEGRHEEEDEAPRRKEVRQCEGAPIGEQEEETSLRTGATGSRPLQCRNGDTYLEQVKYRDED